MSQEKKPYTPPELSIYGDVERITQQNLGGTITDASFPAGFPVDQITTS
jgi:hypothetical protein